MVNSPSKPPLRAAEPRHGQTFDPWNTSATGHQRAENRLSGSTGWRDSRNAKLHSQFVGGAGGGRRVSDKVGAGSKDWDAKAKALIPEHVRARAKCSVVDMLVKPGSMKATAAAVEEGEEVADGQASNGAADLGVESRSGGQGTGRQKRLFDGLVIYVNGSTHPLISDHKLKHVLAEHGARMSIHLGRRQVTHVVLGRQAGSGGAGGGLAGGKLQREIQKTRGMGIKFVGVEWILESIKAGKRLPEARFSHLKIAPKSQESVYGRYSKQLGAPDKVKDEYPPLGAQQLRVEEQQPPPSAQRS